MLDYVADKLRELCGAKDQRVLARLVQNQFKQFVSNAISAIVVTLALVYFFAQDNITPSVIFWASAYSCLATYMLFKLWQYHRTPEEQRDYQYWHRIGLGIVAVSGCFWGLMPFAFFPVQQELTIEMITIGLTVAAISASVMISLPGGFTLYGLAAIGLQSTAIIIFRPDYLILAVGGYVFMGLAIIANIRATRLVAKAELLNFQNQDLLIEAEYQKEKAEQADQAKSRFIAAASHDLRQPLHALSLIASARELSHPNDDFAISIRKSVNSLDGLFNAILNISILDAGKQEVNIRAMRCGDLDEAIGNNPVVEQLSDQIQFGLELTDDVCLCDPDLVLQIVLNLLGNAVKYTEQGKIRVCSGEKNQQVFIEVSDTGIGIAEVDLERIFEEFYQIDNPTRDRSKGIGLGLSIVQRLATLMDAKLECQSVLGQGSQFRLWLPQSLENPTTDEIKPDHGAVMQKADEQLILVVDDDREILNAYHALLMQWGYIPLLAETQDQAINLADEFGQDINAILCDYRLENDLNGNELLGRIRERVNKKIPAIIVTGDTATEEIKLLSELNIPVLFKPVDSRLLGQKLYEVLGG